jgi:hypothetical protein
MSIRYAFVSLLGILGYASAAYADECSHVYVLGAFQGLREDADGISAAGTFRIEGEKDEFKQTEFNFTLIRCEKQSDDDASLECTVTSAVVVSTSINVSPSCGLRLDVYTYPMKELEKGILAGTKQELAPDFCDQVLTINRNSKRVYLAYTNPQNVYSCEPRTEVLMNCTPNFRKADRDGGPPPPRSCGFQ